METTKFEITGMAETLEVFKQLESEIGDKQARSKILIPAVKEAMKPVLAKAKATSPYDEENTTGAHLRDTLTISARRPTRRDRKSNYVTENDSVISIVTTKNIPKKLKKQFAQESKGLSGKELTRAKRKFYATKGIAYDARAVAIEFGTKNMSAQPFMRNALESNAKTVTTILSQILKQRMESFRSRNMK